MKMRMPVVSVCSSFFAVCKSSVFSPAPACSVDVRSTAVAARPAEPPALVPAAASQAAVDSVLQAVLAVATGSTMVAGSTVAAGLAVAAVSMVSLKVATALLPVMAASVYVPAAASGSVAYLGLVPADAASPAFVAAASPMALVASAAVLPLLLLSSAAFSSAV